MRYDLLQTFYCLEDEIFNFISFRFDLQGALKFLGQSAAIFCYDRALSWSVQPQHIHYFSGECFCCLHHPDVTAQQQLSGRNLGGCDIQTN